MPITILKDPIEVAGRLTGLGTSHDLLMEVVNAVVAARADCTENDPFGSRGWRGWQMGTRRNREVHSGREDWEKDDADQIPSIVSKRHRVRLVICNTDDGTALEHGKGPQNRSKKGAATDRAVDVNQTSFIEDLDKATPVVPFRRRYADDEPLLTYYLCVYSEGDDIRAELSCPVSVVSGFFSDFNERIFIIGGDYGPTEPVRRKKGDDDDSEYDITVTRKK